jgi:phage gp36-like protein
MAYTTKEDILSYYNGLTYKDSEGDDNDITETEADKFIDEQKTVIDLVIGKKYILPIIDANDLTYLKLVNDKLVVCQIDKILRTWAADDESEFVRKRNYCKEAKEMLDKIMNGEIPLNTDQKSFRAFKYNKTTVYDDDCECRIEEVSCSD